MMAPPVPSANPGHDDELARALCAAKEKMAPPVPTVRSGRGGARSYHRVTISGRGPSHDDH